MEQLFQKCFAITDSVELCRLYVDYVRSATDFITGGEKARGTLIQAFEFAIGKVGIDVNSDGLWNDYIEFLKSWTPNANWEQQQKVDLIRKVYKKYLVIPTENIQTAWSQYTKWENELNPATAQKFTSEKSAEFMLARSWHTEWNIATEKKLKRTITPYSTIDPHHQETVLQQLNYWLQWIELEKKNKLEIKDESLVEKRISYTYKQATYALPFVGELWFKYSKYLLSNNEEGNLSNCIVLLQDGCGLNPKSMLLSFQLAELYEKDNSFEMAKQTFNKLISTLTNDHNNVTSQITEINDRIASKQQQQNNNDQDDNEDEPKQKEQSTPQPPIYRISLADSTQLQTLEKTQKRLADAITLSYTKLTIATKRAEGIKEARNAFRIARKFNALGYQIFVANALLEHYADKHKAALNIFDLARRKFSTNGEFLLEYLDYLIMINDVDTIRNVIQTSNTSISKEIASLTETIAMPEIDPLTKTLKTRQLKQMRKYLKKLFKKYISFSATYLSLDVTNSFTKTCEQLFPEDDPIELFTDRYRLGSVNVIKRDEIGDYYLDEDIDDDEPHRKRRRLSTQLKPRDDDISANSAVRDVQQSSRIEEEILNQNQPQQEESFVGPTITALMTALPNASYFGLPSESVFDCEKLVTLFANLSNIPL